MVCNLEPFYFLIKNMHVTEMRTQVKTLLIGSNPCLLMVLLSTPCNKLPCFWWWNHEVCKWIFVPRELIENDLVFTFLNVFFVDGKLAQKWQWVRHDFIKFSLSFSRILFLSKIFSITLNFLHFLKKNLVCCEWSHSITVCISSITQSCEGKSQIFMRSCHILKNCITLFEHGALGVLFVLVA